VGEDSVQQLVMVAGHHGARGGGGREGGESR
jgi:hypothetical protein